MPYGMWKTIFFQNVISLFFSFFFLIKQFFICLFLSAVANVSFQNFAPGFIARFIESHAVMLQGNAGLKPKEGEYTSRPWEWPINLRVSNQGYT